MKKRVMSFGLIVLLSLSVVLLGGCEGKTQKIVNEAKISFDKGDYEKSKELLEPVKAEKEAEGLYKKALIESLLKAGENDFQKGKYKDVVIVLKQYVAEDARAKTMYEASQYKIFEESIQRLVESNNGKEIVAGIIAFQDYYGNQKGKSAGLQKLLVGKIDGALKVSERYQDFLLWENVVGLLKKSEGENADVCAKKIEKALKKNFVNEAKLALIGTWTRKDETGMKGSQIIVGFDGTTGMAKLTLAANNDWGFVEGDVKWKGLKILNKESIVLKDLEKGYNEQYDYLGNVVSILPYHRYNEATATIDYAKMQINMHVTGELYSSGENQVWVKEKSE